MQLSWTKRLGSPRCLQGMVLLVALAFGSGGPILAEATVAPGSLDEAVAQIEQAHTGRVLSARVEQRNDGEVYIIRLLTEDQQVRTFEIEGSEGVRP